MFYILFPVSLPVIMYPGGDRPDPCCSQWRRRSTVTLHQTRCISHSNGQSIIRRRAQQTQNICITFIQCWSNVEDVGPTLYKCYTNVFCLLGWTLISM